MLCLHIEPSMSQHHTHSTCGDKVKSTKGTRHKNFNSIPTCHHCGVSGHIRPNCFQIRSQKPWDKLHVPRKDELGIENLVKNLSDQVKLISEKLGSLTPNEKKSVLLNKKKNTSNKQVWIKKDDNLCLVAHTALKILDTCLWYLDSGCSKHMIGDKTLLKDVHMGRGGRITYGDGSQSKVIGTKNDVWTLVPRPADHNVIGTKWIFKNKLDEHGIVIRNKAHLVAQGYTQIEGVDFDETFAPVSRLKSIRILLSIACHLGFKLY
jgi:hypothetical protein